MRIKQLKERAAGATVPSKLEVEEVDETLIALKNANARRGPSTKTKKVGLLRKGTEVSVTGRVKGGNWLRIVLNGEDAFVYVPLLGRR